MNPRTEKTEQNMQNRSFDKDNQIMAVEAIGFDGTNLTRLQATSQGLVKVTV